MLEDLHPAGNVPQFRQKPTSTRVGEPCEDRHRPMAPEPDAAPLDQRKRASGTILTNSFGLLLLRAVAGGTLFIVQLLRHAPATADFNAMNNHLLRDIGMSRTDIDSLVSHKGRWS
jgi:uncharacterized protein YjiS (DUF1127 family)